MTDPHHTIPTTAVDAKESEEAVDRTIPAGAVDAITAGVVDGKPSRRTSAPRRWSTMTIGWVAAAGIMPSPATAARPATQTMPPVQATTAAPTVPAAPTPRRQAPGVDLSDEERSRVDEAVDHAISSREYQRWKPVHVGISPDGNRVAWSASRRDERAIFAWRRGASAVESAPVAADGVPLALPDDPVWSPDGRRLAFTAIASPPGGATPSRTRGVFVWDPAAGAVTAMPTPVGDVGDLSWSHDGGALLYLLIADATRATGYASAEHRMVGVVGEGSPEVSRLYRVDVATGEGRYLTGPDVHVYDFSTSQGSGELTFLGGPVPGDAAWTLSSVYVARDDGEPSAPATPLVTPEQLPGGLRGLQMALPRISPDGRRVAFLCGEMTDMTIYGGDLCVADRPATGRAAVVTDLTPGLDGTALFAHWATDDAIDVVELHQAEFRIVRRSASDPRAVAARSLDLGETTASGGLPASPAAPVYGAVSFSADGRRAAFALEGHDLAPDVFLADDGALRNLSGYGVGQTPPTRTVSLTWRADGGPVQGWMTYPTRYEPGRTYPLLVMAHGGPGWATTSFWDANPFRGDGSFWADLGYFVLAPNFRGSFGQGEAFTRGNFREMGHSDLRDILAGVTAAEDRFPIDRHRIGMIGWSYGGFMAMFAPTQTDRFRAVVAGAGISDLSSFYGTATDGAWVFPVLGGTPEQSPAAYARSSAISFASRTRTPTLLLHGELDGGVPPTQSIEYWRALVSHRVPTRLVIYPGEGHSLDRADISDALRRSAEWFARWMPAATTRAR